MAMRQNPVLSIVIPVFNKWNFTKACLTDLFKLPKNHEIIVVDNGSIDVTQENLHDNEAIVYHRLPANQGFAVACNEGYALASAPNVLFLNNDIRVRADHTTWTQKLIEKCGNGLVGPTMGQLDKDLNFVQEANKVLDGKSYMSGWCLAASKDVWSKLEIPRNPLLIHDYTPPPQIFSEEFGLAYFEDTDLSFRARELQIPMQVVDIPVVHFGKQTSQQLNTYQLYKRARQIFVNKWQKK